MDKIFITGSGGFIGSQLSMALRDRGWAVRGLVRRPKASQAGIEYVCGDILDRDVLRRAMDGCRYTFHLAAYAKNWSQDRCTFDRVNIEGTQNVFSVAQELGIERVVWTSTIVTLGPTPPGAVHDENTPRMTEHFYTDYERTKTVMERESVRWVEEGLPLVTVNPTRVFGPGLLSESNTVTSLIQMHRKGQVPILFNLGRNVGNYVLVDDVVQGHILAMERGQLGSRYILGGENVSLKELFRAVDRLDGVKRSQIPIFWHIPMAIAHGFQAGAKLFGFHPPFTPGWLRTFLVDWAFTSAKAQRELGYQWTPFEEAICKTCQWLSNNPEPSR